MESPGQEALLVMDTTMTEREADLTWFRSFVEASRWRFAKTYVESYPHEWTLERWVDQAIFARAILCIERWGAVEPFWRTQRKYLHVDDRKYWHMGEVGSDDPEKRPTLINRTWLDVDRYRDDAMQLGYAGDRLEQLVDHWKVLLDKASG